MRWRGVALAVLVAVLAGSPLAPPVSADPAPGLPDPPPVDMGQLPTDTQPTALPGLRQATSCARPPPADPGEVRSLTWGVRSMKLAELRRIDRGADVRIAVIDSGVTRHPLLTGRLVDGGDYVAGETGLADCEGHGTAVAGIAAGSVDADSEFAGVAPQATVISVRQTSASFHTRSGTEPESNAGDTTTLAKAIVRAVELGAEVINISEVSCVPVADAARKGAAVQAAVHHAVERDVVVVVAAGNRGVGAGSCPEQSGNSIVVLPAWYDDDVLAVASVAPDGTASQFGIRGPWVDVAAPGERVLSLTPNGAGLTDKMHAPTQVGPLQGSSFAAPAVAGLAALIRARYPRLSARQVMDRITATASRATEGRNDSTGWGTIDTREALTRAPAVLAPPTGPADPTLTGTGELPLSPGDRQPSTPATLWAGVLGLVAAAAVAALAVLRARDRRIGTGTTSSGPHDYPCVDA